MACQGIEHVSCIAQLAERRSLVGELTLSCTLGLQLTGDLCVENGPLQVSQLSLSSFWGR